MTTQENYKHIVRIANVDIPGNKPVRISLTKIKGLGINLADAACIIAKVPRDKKTGSLSDEQIAQLDVVVKDLTNSGIPAWMFNRRKDYESGEDKHLLTGTMNFTKENDLKRLSKIKSWRGLRLMKRLPVRGQRTRSNFRRSKGKVVGVKKKGKK
ncbi:30S ribosomal protein S13 [Candidatus Woesearchaeota archaeon]|jgi:small subunit ribosomal protein S13|nr:30S ribosomal protein S13 [Candidatus Woesearchaeota archaeon]MBT5740275.1 30S ribosomal protein S13 [Candidatus Woesearchaeota archaeon]